MSISSYIKGEINQRDFEVNMSAHEATPKMLLVDDDFTFLQVLARAMRKRGFDVLTADNVPKAESLLLKHSPDFAVVDLKMEGPSGLALIASLRASNPEMKIVILTGYASIATAVEAIKLGASNYLCKPANADEIISALLCKAANPEQPVKERPMSVDRLEWEHIQQVLTANQGNISATARQLGMHRRTLQRKLQKRPVRE